MDNFLIICCDQNSDKYPLACYYPSYLSSKYRLFTLLVSSWWSPVFCYKGEKFLYCLKLIKFPFQFIFIKRLTWLYINKYLKNFSRSLLKMNTGGNDDFWKQYIFFSRIFVFHSFVLYLRPAPAMYCTQIIHSFIL